MRGKTSTRSGVRTHKDICLLDIKSNALTSRPSWYFEMHFLKNFTAELSVWQGCVSGVCLS